MPRKSIEPERTVEFLSVLDRKGNLDRDCVPEIGEDRLVSLYRAMRRARQFDERLLKLQRQGRIGTFAPVKGQEAAQVGAVAALNDDDWLVPAFRETAALLWRGVPMTGILLYNAGFNEGGAVPDEQYTLPIAIPVASQIPHAVGLAYAMAQRDEARIAMTFFGDGATSEGDFHEAMNFAAVFKTPTVFVCQNNQWAISVPRAHQTKSKTLAQKALAYDIPGIQVDGNDIFAVYAAAQEAVARARDGDGPTMIECLTYRMEVHTTADDPSRYRSDKEVEKWAKRDPIERFEKHLVAEKILKKKAPDAIGEEIDAEIEKAWQEAKEKIETLENPAEMFAHVYAELPPQMQESRAILERVQEVDDQKIERAQANKTNDARAAKSAQGKPGGDENAAGEPDPATDGAATDGPADENEET